MSPQAISKRLLIHLFALAGNHARGEEARHCGRFAALRPRSSALNAFADGDPIYVTTTMMRFAEDDELHVVLARELAHNAMGHSGAE